MAPTPTCMPSSRPRQRRVRRPAALLSSGVHCSSPPPPDHRASPAPRDSPLLPDPPPTSRPLCRPAVSSCFTGDAPKKPRRPPRAYVQSVGGLLTNSSRYLPPGGREPKETYTAHDAERPRWDRQGPYIEGREEHDDRGPDLRIGDQEHGQCEHREPQPEGGRRGQSRGRHGNKQCVAVVGERSASKEQVGLQIQRLGYDAGGQLAERGVTSTGAVFSR